VALFFAGLGIKNVLTFSLPAFMFTLLASEDTKLDEAVVVCGQLPQVLVIQLFTTPLIRSPG
jgi:hypothetical protein